MLLDVIDWFLLVVLCALANLQHRNNCIIISETVSSFGSFRFLKIIKIFSRNLLF